MPTITKDDIKVELTPEDMARCLWSMSDQQQAQMFSHLMTLTDEYHLMMQFLFTREECEKMKEQGDSSALDAFQIMFSAGYKYIGE